MVNSSTECAYTSTTLPTGCSAADSCSKDGTTYYASTCQACYTGYSLSNGSCNKTCTYTATSKPSGCSTAGSCQLGSASGTTTYYSTTCSSCNSGYKLSSGTCVEEDQNCVYRYTSLSGKQTSYTTCTGEDTGTTYYKETACITDKCDYCGDGEYIDEYMVSNGRCVCYAFRVCDVWLE